MSQRRWVTFKTWIVVPLVFVFTLGAGALDPARTSDPKESA